MSKDIRNKREYRLLKQLLKQPTSRKELNTIVGALNLPEHVRQLRKKGRDWVIDMHRFWVKDRDGKRCNPGIYSLPEAEKPHAREAIKKWENGAATPSSRCDS